MKLKVAYVVLVIVCLFGFSLGTAKASVSPMRTYQFRWQYSTVGIYDLNLTAPVYASRGSVISLTVGFYVWSAVNLTALRLAVTAKIDNVTKQQIYYSVLLPPGSYGNGTDRTFTAAPMIPSNAMLGSSLNVSLYTDANKWFVFPTEIRDMNYDDLQSAYNNAQNQITTLNQQVNTLSLQVANLTTDKNNLNQQVNTLNQRVTNLTTDKNNLNQQINTLDQQVASLTSDKNTLNGQIADLNSQISDLNSQISDLKEQTSLRTLTIPIAMGIITIVAVVVAIYMFYSKVKLAQSVEHS